MIEATLVFLVIPPTASKHLTIPIKLNTGVGLVAIVEGDLLPARESCELLQTLHTASPLLLLPTLDTGQTW